MVEIKVGNVYSYQSLVYKRGHNTFKTKNYKMYEQEIGYQINHLQPIQPPYHIVLHFDLKGKKRIDLDNASKPILDILQNHGIIDNDQNIVILQLSKSNGNQTNTIHLSVETAK